MNAYKPAASKASVLSANSRTLVAAVVVLAAFLASLLFPSSSALEIKKGTAVQPDLRAPAPLLPDMVTYGRLTFPRTSVAPGGRNASSVAAIYDAFKFTRSATIAITPILSDDFNDNSLDRAKWDASNLFSGFTDTGVPIAETLQRLEIGPLPQNIGETSGASHYRGVRTVNTYNFTDAYSYVELVQAASSNTKADAMFTIGTSADAYYRIYVEKGALIGLRKIGATKTTLFTIPYDAVSHRFLRIRHDAATGNLTLDTAAGSNGVPSNWGQRYSEPWASSISLTGMIFELKGGTWQQEPNQPGTVIFDNFQIGSNSTPPANPPTVTAISPSSGSASGGTSVTITGTGFSSGATVSFGGSLATNVTVVSSASITATTPAHAAGSVNVVVTNTDSQSGTLPSGYTYNSEPGGGTTSAANISSGQFGQNTGGGNYTFPGNVTVNGNIAAKYQDMAEWVPASHAMAAGTVVVLDPKKSNQVTASTRSYDSRVAGVVSLRPGLTLGEAAEGSVLVATTGRVKVIVDASNGPIQIGDLLVTSDIEGVAMKSEPIYVGGAAIHRPGTLIGKALEPLAKGKGEILVLLSLQ